MMQAASTVALLLAGSAGRLADALGAGHGFLSLRTDLQPEVVARTLVQVEDKWKSEVMAFAECKELGSTEVACMMAPQQFEKSCSTIVGAVFQASSGDRGVVDEYLQEVCAQDELKGWRSNLCQAFSSAVAAAMTADSYQNREALDSTSLCRDFWQGLAGEERQRVKKAAMAVERAKAEEEKKAAARAQAEDKAAAAAAAEARHKQLAEVGRKAAEARQRVEDQAKKVRDEAENKAKAAAEKMSEAQAALEETKKVQAVAAQTLASAGVVKVAGNATEANTTRNATEMAQQNVTANASGLANATRSA